VREAVRLVGEPVEVEGKYWRGSVGAPDGGSAILPFADRDVGFISAITMLTTAGAIIGGSGEGSSRKRKA
jgi:hypothetical protein